MNDQQEQKMQENEEVVTDLRAYEDQLSRDIVENDLRLQRERVEFLIKAITADIQIVVRDSHLADTIERLERIAAYEHELGKMTDATYYVVFPDRFDPSPMLNTPKISLYQQEFKPLEFGDDTRVQTLGEGLPSDCRYGDK